MRQSSTYPPNPTHTTCLLLELPGILILHGNYFQERAPAQRSHTRVEVRCSLPSKLPASPPPFLHLFVSTRLPPTTSPSAPPPPSQPAPQPPLPPSQPPHPASASPYCTPH